MKAAAPLRKDHYRVRLRTRANRNPFEFEHSLIERDIGYAPAGVLVVCRRNIPDLVS